MEGLEKREMFASISGCGSVVTIYGTDNWHDDARVDISSGQVKIQTSSVPTSGFVLTPNVVQRKCSLNTVTKIRFFGHGGDDSFINNWNNVTTYAEGGAGNDYLEGYGKRDEFYGGSGSDTLKGYGGNDLLHGSDGADKLYGGSGNDDLYGDSGRDSLYGDSGLDGLYGGRDDDALYGGSGSDRFLIVAGQREHKDAKAEDAVISFAKGDKHFDEEEIEDVDAGLRLLHHKTGNDNLLELSGGKPVTFYRYTKSSTGSTTLADNNSAGRIRMYDSAFSSVDRTAATVVHEMAHNWDTEHANWSRWLSRSGWRSTRPSSADAKLYSKATSTTENWWHLKSAGFASSYAKTNPREDWAESWQSYFVHEHGMPDLEGLNALPSSKISHLDAFFASLT
jgi:Ca2+-binding RTX toxin-like protein